MHTSAAEAGLVRALPARSVAAPTPTPTIEARSAPSTPPFECFLSMELPSSPGIYRRTCRHPYFFMWDAPGGWGGSAPHRDRSVREAHLLLHFETTTCR